MSQSLPADDLERALGWCAGDWEELRGARLFVTGGTGFIGTWLLASALAANRRHGLGLAIVALSRDPGRFAARWTELARDPALTLIPGDVQSFPAPTGAFTHVIHAATDASAKLNAEQPLAMIDTIVGGTRRVLDLAVAAGARRLLFVSSGAVYGRQPPQLALVPETHLGGPDPLAANAAYGEGKRLAEQLCAAVGRARGLAVAVARCWAFVGPGLPLDAHFAVGNFIRDAMRGGPIVVGGDGTTVRSYLYAADLAAWLWRIFLRGEPLRAYNVGSDEAVSIGDLARTVASCFAPAPAVEIRGKPSPGVPPDRYVPDVSRARTELGLAPWTSMREGIEKTIAWHRTADNLGIPHGKGVF
jgi:dTDP-glucose 4,6-dehydratase